MARFLPRLAAAVAALTIVGATSARSQGAGPGDFDLLLRTDSAEYATGATVTATAGIAVRAAGVQGYSYGVRHDPALLEIRTASIGGTDAEAALVSPFFEVTSITDEQDGYITGVVLSFTAPAELPLGDFVSTSISTYGVVGAAPATTTIEFTSELSAPGGNNAPPVDINVTVLGRAVVPAVIEGAELAIVEEDGGPDGLAFVLGGEEPCELRADQESTFDLEVHLANGDEAETSIQAWSYGISLDRAALEAVEGRPGADSAALKGGAGPDVAIYNLDESSEDGTVRGVTVGVIIDTGAPADNVLPVAAGASAHLDTIVLRSVESLGVGESQETTVAVADDVLGGNVTIQALVVVDTFEVFPDATASKVITLLGPPDVDEPLFIRGDSNNDRRVDIADGVWIVNMLFYGGPMTACLPAADANRDTRVDITDALYVINYQLQPGATPDRLFAAPPAPFPNCGTDPEASIEDCPAGSHVCSQ